jgi:hypothetical protein
VSTVIPLAQESAEDDNTMSSTLTYEEDSNAVIDEHQNASIQAQPNQSVFTCTGVFPLNNRKFNDSIDLFNKYACRNFPESVYHTKLIRDSPQANIYHKECDSVGVMFTNTCNSGIWSQPVTIC